jgi:hypothetical protein
MRAIRFGIACILLFAATAIVILAASPGSDSRRAGEVWGCVSYHGRPLTGGAIVFAPVHEDDGPGAGAVIRKNGTYSINSGWARGPKVRSEYKVCILPDKRKSAQRSTQVTGTSPEDDPTSPAPETSTAGRPRVVSDFPARFVDLETSGLRVALGLEPTRVDIEMRD